MGTRKAAERALEPSGEREQPGAGWGGPPAAPLPRRQQHRRPGQLSSCKGAAPVPPAREQETFPRRFSAARSLARSACLSVRLSVAVPTADAPPAVLLPSPGSALPPRPPASRGGSRQRGLSAGGPEPRRGLGAAQLRRGHVPAAGGRGGSPCLLPAGSTAGPGGPVR